MNSKHYQAEVEVVIIGAGVVGLAVAVELAQENPAVPIVLVEKNRQYGQEVSSRSSEVIHAGLYYPSGSLKSQLCLEGNRLLYDFCSQYKVPHRRTGKLVTATATDEIENLQNLYKLAAGNGVELECLEAGQVKKIEPGIEAKAALFSPSTGIIDSTRLMYALYHLAHESGVTVLFNSPLLDIDVRHDAYLLGFAQETIKTRVVINCAGLYSDAVAAMAGLDVDTIGYRLHYCRGEYYRLRRRCDFSHLIYPMPEKNGLGIHLTLDLQGGQRLGPDTRYVDKIDYSIDDTCKEKFYLAARRYLPWLEIDDLQPDYAGIRPKLQTEGGGFRDFVISEETHRGLPGFVNLIGIESPGLTSALAIARYVADLLEGMI
jgi:L-2-hydroxyglutarate oxidase LhgO